MKTVTIKDVAREAGVSISVVSYVLNNNPNVSISGETRERVVNATKRLNYIPNSIARSMRTRKSMLIGLATFWDISDSVFTDILKGIDSVAEKRNYSVTYCNIRNGLNSNKIIELYNRRQIDGVILLLHVDPAESFCEAEFINNIKRNKIPAVVIDGSTQDPDMSYVYIDYHGTTYKAVNYLCGLGHKSFCYMLPDEREINKRQAIQRINGYKDALDTLNLADSGIYFNKESINDIINIIKSPNYTGKPTAIVVNKTSYVSYLLKAFSEHGIKVPGDVSVIACNEQNIAGYLTPPLTTVKIPTYDIGIKSADILFDLLQRKSLNIKLKLSNEVIERESCRKI